MLSHVADLVAFRITNFAQLPHPCTALRRKPNWGAHDEPLAVDFVSNHVA